MFGLGRGIWKCKRCTFHNQQDAQHCSICTAPKDDTIPKHQPIIASKKVLPVAPQKVLAGKKRPAAAEKKPVVPEKRMKLMPLQPTGAPFFNFAKPAAAPDIPAFPLPSSSAGTGPGVNSAGIFGTSFGATKPTLDIAPAEPLASGSDLTFQAKKITNEQQADFEPAVDFPEADVKTGEESEVLSFSQQSELFVLVDNEWRERGVGGIKILRNQQNGTLR